MVQISDKLTAEIWSTIKRARDEAIGLGRERYARELGVLLGQMQREGMAGHLPTAEEIIEPVAPPRGLQGFRDITEELAGDRSLGMNKIQWTETDTNGNPSRLLDFVGEVICDRHGRCFATIDGFRRSVRRRKEDGVFTGAAYAKGGEG